MNIIIDNWCCFIYWCYLNDSWMASNVFEQHQLSQQQQKSSNNNNLYPQMVIKLNQRMEKRLMMAHRRVNR
ncbi:MAG: hypothetical protein QRY16_21600, partial [Enterobacterales bacterium endosymbiont of Blomia tropicalis]|uniref:hypothetical protein n=1 Tax=Mixta mediterraneensis TaxID=2758443 RepID=UPI0025A7ABB6